MKIYIAEYSDYDTHSVEGVFATRELAKEFIDAAWKRQAEMSESMKRRGLKPHQLTGDEYSEWLLVCWRGWADIKEHEVIGG